MQSQPAASPIEHSPAPQGFRHVLNTFRHWCARDVTSSVNQAAVIETRRAECEITARYLLMVSMSAGIAILGLLLSSPAVVIGAMLLSPLMDPIMGVGFALAVGDYRWLRQAARSLALGVVFAVLFCALVVFLSPLQQVTSEIAARTRPNLFDLLVALFSAVAGAYAMIRGREGTIVGVAIATALMPPLAVVGFGLATFNGTVFWGALFLFVTNLTTIALTATAMARFYGFSTHLSEKQTQFHGFLIFGAFVVLAVPLGLSLYRIGWESQASRQISAVVLDVFPESARLDRIEPDYEGAPITVTATVLTPRIVGNAEEQVERAIERRLGQPVAVSLTQIRVGTSAQAAEEAQLANTRREEAEARLRAENIATRLSLLAGVPADEVTVDRERRRALVTARPLDGASLAAYNELERRIDATEPEWDIRIAPPLRPLPDVTFEEVAGEEVAGEEVAGEDGQAPRHALTAEGRRAVALIAWAQQRVRVPVRLTGPAEAVAAVRTALSTHSVTVQADVRGSGYGPVSVAWDTGGN